MSFNFGTLTKKIGSLFDGNRSSLVSKSKIKYQAIRDGLDANHRIVIEGKVAPAASRIEICLLAFDTIDDENLRSGDVALKLVIVPSGGYAVLSSRTNKQWSEEERTQRGRLPPPLMQMNKFLMDIVVDPIQYKIEVNGVPFVNYLHRHSLKNVRLLSYEGDFEVLECFVQPGAPVAGFDSTATISGPTTMNFTPNYSQSPEYQSDYSPSSSSTACATISSLPSREVNINGTALNNPKLPVLLPIKAGLRIGTALSLTDAQMTGNRFDISFYHGNDPYENSDGIVAFHMEVYLQERAIVRNSYKNGKWQKEERDDLQCFPFLLGKKFDLAIFAEGNRFKVNVDGQNLFDFYHRLTPISLIDYLCVHGNIEMPLLRLTHSPR